MQNLTDLILLLKQKIPKLTAKFSSDTMCLFDVDQFATRLIKAEPPLIPRDFNFKNVYHTIKSLFSLIHQAVADDFLEVMTSKNLVSVFIYEYQNIWGILPIVTIHYQYGFNKNALKFSLFFVRKV